MCRSWFHLQVCSGHTCLYCGFIREVMVEFQGVKVSRKLCVCFPKMKWTVFSKPRGKWAVRVIPSTLPGACPGLISLSCRPATPFSCSVVTSWFVTRTLGGRGACEEEGLEETWGHPGPNPCWGWGCSGPHVLGHRQPSCGHTSCLYVRLHKDH